MGHTWTILKRELASYFTTPIAYVFIVIYLFLSGIFAFYLGNFFGRGQADLNSFFTVITSYSIHYTKLYDIAQLGPTKGSPWAHALSC